MTDPITQSMIQGAAGAAGGALGVEDVFSTYVYKGNATARTINNGLDLAGEGGLVWTKIRTNGYSHALMDSEIGLDKCHRSERNDQDFTYQGNGMTSFNSDGYSLGDDQHHGLLNYSSSEKYVSWSFRKAKGFFDVVKWTGNGSTRTISHSLGSVPGCIIVKNTTQDIDWAVWHRGVAAVSSTNTLILNENTSASTNNTYFDNGSTPPTADEFTVHTSNRVNASGQTYVAYVFAHENASFGPDEDKSIISCGSFQGNNSTDGPTVTLPFEPAYILLKAGTTGGNWYLLDTMRGIGPDNNQNEVVTRFLKANTSAGENYTNIMKIDNSNGYRFKLTDSDGEYNSQTMVFIAIAAETGRTSKEIEAGSASSVFTMDGTPANAPRSFDSGFPVDIGLVKILNTQGNWVFTGRKLQSTYLATNTTGVRGTGSTNYTFDMMDGMWQASMNGTDYQAWMWKRYAGFDAVEYKGSGSADYVYHSLGRLPEMIWVKKKNGTTDWRVYHKGLGTSNDPQDYSLVLNDADTQHDDATIWNDALPEVNRFTVGTNNDVNGSGEDYIAMLWASVDGVSKIGSYVGQNTSLTLDFGFTPRFLYIKRFSGGNNVWMVFDTVRGIGAGNPPYVHFDQNASQSADRDWIDPISNGIIVNSNSGGYHEVNASGSSYIYYAHA